jgi:hypothetical protein
MWRNNDRPREESKWQSKTHIAIQEKKNGMVVDWMEHVNDEQYRKV